MIPTDSMEVFHEDDLPNRPMSAWLIVMAALGAVFLAIGAIGMGAAVYLLVADLLS